MAENFRIDVQGIQNPDWNVFGNQYRQSIAHNLKKLPCTRKSLSNRWEIKRRQRSERMWRERRHGKKVISMCRDRSGRVRWSRAKSYLDRNHCGWYKYSLILAYYNKILARIHSQICYRHRKFMPFHRDWRVFQIRIVSGRQRDKPDRVWLFSLVSNLISAWVQNIPFFLRRP